MGLVEAIFALGGLAVMLRAFGSGQRKLLPVLAFPAATVLFILLMTPISLLFWQIAPLANSVQFPWRLLAPIGVCSSMCTAFLAVPKRLDPCLAIAVGSALILTASIALPGETREIPEDNLSVAMVARFEYSTGMTGISNEAEWLPFVANLEADSQTREPLPLSGTTVQRTGLLAHRFEVSTTEPTVLRVHAYAFPGWRAKVDGRPVSVYPSKPFGLVSIDVPVGNHTIDVSFEDTPVRTTGRIISLAALSVLALACLAGARRRKSGYFWSLSIAAVVTALAFAGVMPRAPSVMGQELRLNGQRPMQVDFGEVVRLAGLELKAPTSETGWDAEAVLYWQALQAMSGDILTSLEWLDPQGVSYPAWTGRPIFGTSHTHVWLTNEVVTDLRKLRLPERPMRQARLRITVWQNGRQLGSADLGTVDNLPAASFTPALASSPTKVDFAGQMGLVDFGVRLEGQSRGLRADAAEKVLLAAQPGDKVRVDLWWRALSAFQDDYTVFIHLYDQKGELLAQHDNQPGNRYRPTSLWQKGDIVEDSQWLTIPPVDNPGIYRLEIGSYLLKTLDRLVVTGSAKTTAFLGLMKISPPPATLTPSNRLDATYGESIVLRGYDLAMEKPVVNPAGEGKLTLDLFWRAGGGVVADYKVFVHLLDGAGKLVAQQDGEPLDGNYPTSFWTKGDELVDHHEIRLAGNDLAKVQQVLVGLYDSVTGQRLATTSGSDFITIK